MARENGQLRTCDRCGKTVFLKSIGAGDADGGYTKWIIFENEAGWSSETDIGDLCAECSEKFEELKQEFKNRVEKSKNKENKL